jgi:hypothetical protein
MEKFKEGVDYVKGTWLKLKGWTFKIRVNPL